MMCERQTVFLQPYDAQYKKVQCQFWLLFLDFNAYTKRILLLNAGKVKCALWGTPLWREGVSRESAHDLPFTVQILTFRVESAPRGSKVQIFADDMAERVTTWENVEHERCSSWPLVDTRNVSAEGSLLACKIDVRFKKKKPKKTSGGVKMTF